MDESMTKLDPRDLVWRVNDIPFGRYGGLYDKYEATVSLQDREMEGMVARVYAVPQDDRLRPVGAACKMAEDGHWWPDLDVSVVHDVGPYDIKSLHVLTTNRLQLDWANRRFSPIVYLNEFWRTKERRIPLDQRDDIRLSFNPISLYKMQLTYLADHVLSVNEQVLAADDSLGGIDSIKVHLSYWHRICMVGITEEYSSVDFVADTGCISAAHIVRYARLQERHPVLASTGRPDRPLRPLHLHQRRQPSHHPGLPR